MKKEAGDSTLSTSSFIFGIQSIVFSLLVPLLGVITGVIDLFMAKGQNTIWSKRGSITGIIGIVLSVISFITILYISNSNPELLIP